MTALAGVVTAGPEDVLVTDRSSLSLDGPEFEVVLSAAALAPFVEEPAAEGDFRRSSTSERSGCRGCCCCCCCGDRHCRSCGCGRCCCCGHCCCCGCKHFLLCGGLCRHGSWLEPIGLGFRSNGRRSTRNGGFCACETDSSGSDWRWAGHVLWDAKTFTGGAIAGPVSEEAAESTSSVEEACDRFVEGLPGEGVHVVFPEVGLWTEVCTAS